MKYKLTLVVFCCSLLGFVDARAEQNTVEDHELNAGPVKILVHEDCEIDSTIAPNFKSSCGITATLTYGQAKITVDEIFLGALPDGRYANSADDVAWVENRYVSLAYRTGGKAVRWVEAVAETHHKRRHGIWLC